MIQITRLYETADEYTPVSLAIQFRQRAYVKRLDDKSCFSLSSYKSQKIDGAETWRRQSCQFFKIISALFVHHLYKDTKNVLAHRLSPRKG